MTYNSEKVNELANVILQHKRRYYQGRPVVSDLEYDRLEETLRLLAPRHPVLNLVGDGEDSKSRKTVHKVPMLSLAKTYEVSELISWTEGRSVMGTFKIDGNSLSIIYQQGKLALAKTRGNGREGEDVTDKVSWVADCVPEVAFEGELEIRGELYCSDPSFSELSQEMVARGLERPTNPRNIVAGILGRKNHQDLARFFKFFAFDVLDSNGIAPFKLESEKFQWLSASGFKVPHHKLCFNSKGIEHYLSEAQSYMEDGEIGIDGVVFSLEDLIYHRDLGSTSHHPRYKMSFKWTGETATAKISTITWATSRLGIVTPVAVIEPVQLSGATISNITLHNAAHVKSYNLKSGDKIEIIRSGEVIPKFLRVLEESSNHLDLPSQCSSCKAPLDFDGVRLLCPNKNDCPAQKSGLVLNWIKAVEIEDLSEKRLQQMIDLGLISGIADLYRLEIPDLMKLPATKEKMAEKLLRNIKNSQNPELSQFLTGLGIAGMGMTSWESLIEHFSTLENIRQLNVSQLQQVEGFAEKTAQAIVQGLSSRSDIIEEILRVGVTPKLSTVNSGQGPLSQMSFAITGTLSQPRDIFERLIHDNGGRVVGSVSKNTNVLLTNDSQSNSSKAKKARDLGVEVWGEDDFMKKIKTY